MKQISRRDFLKLGLLGSCTAMQACNTDSIFKFTTTDVRLTKVDIYIKNLSQVFENYKIAFVSDLHLGPYFPKAWLENALNKLKTETYDLLLLGGDFINLPEKSLGYELYGVIRQAEYTPIKGRLSKISERIFYDCAQIVSKYRPVDGICAVKGNHDNWISGKQCTEAFEKYGIKLLNNTSYKISRANQELEIIGFDDYWTGLPNIKRAINSVSDRSIKVCLAHNPDYFVELKKNCPFQFDLSIAGHTHGGQIKLPLWGPIICNIDHRQFSEGLLKINDSSYYTSRGIGVVEFPHRINCPAEVCIFNLKKFEAKNA